MTVFLRWGIFGLLAVAAVLYAYNASKRLAASKSVEAPAAVTAAPSAEDADTDETPIDPSISAPVHVASEEPPIELEQMPAHCVTELLVAQRALAARRDREPFDRVLRSQHVAFESDARRRRRLEQIAREYFDRGTPDPDDPELRRLIMRRCG
jgi:hypothetical protein